VAAALLKGRSMAISAPDVITRYFAAQSARDFDTLVTLFAIDAVVIDEGQTRRGASEIRAWRENVASAYEYTTELVGLEAAGEDMYVARVHLAGNFPGGTVDLRYRFTVDGEQIRRLEIVP
jgi:ketosteroid isomerase-like protein